MGQVERGDRVVFLETLVRLSESLEVSVDFLLKDSVIINDNGYLNQVAVLLNGCSVKDKEIILDVIKIMINLKK